MVEYEADSDLRDTEQVPLKSQVASRRFEQEVLPHAPDAWIANGQRLRSAMRFRLPAISTSRRRSGRWKKSRRHLRRAAERGLHDWAGA